MHRLMFSFTLLLTFTSSLNAADPFHVTSVLFPHENKHNHASCIVELSNGDLLTAWYTGTGERKSDDVRIVGSRLKHGEKTWSPRFELADTIGYPDCNPALFAGPDGSLWMFWPTILDHRWESALLKFAKSSKPTESNGAPEWTREGVIHITPTGFAEEWAKAVSTIKPESVALLKPFFDKLEVLSKDLLYQRLGWMPRVHPTVLPSGRWLLPLYTDTFSVSLVAISDDQGKTWTTSGPMIGFGNIQPSLVRKTDGSIVAFMRENGPRLRIRLCTSKDEGQTWGPVTESILANPGAGVEAIALQNGHWAIIYNDSIKGRHTLAVSISDDEGATWGKTRHLEAHGVGMGSYHYPSILQSKDGSLHVTYTEGSLPIGSTIRHAHFNEEWVRQGDAKP